MSDKKELYWSLKTKGLPDSKIAKRINVHRDTITRWNKYFEKNDFIGLTGISPGGKRVQSTYLRIIDEIEKTIADNPNLNIKQLHDLINAEHCLNVGYKSFCKFLKNYNLR